MPPATPRADAGRSLYLMVQGAASAVGGLFDDARRKLAGRLTVEGRGIRTLFDSEQRATHGLAWFATYVEALRQLADYARRLDAAGKLGEIEELIVRIGAGEYLAQIAGGIPISQNEIVRLADLGLAPAEVAARWTATLDGLIASGNTAVNRARLVELLRQNPETTAGDCGLDEGFDQVREEMRGFADTEIAPHAQDWRRDGGAVPDGVIRQMVDLGVFSLAAPEEFAGMGLGREAMCIVAEELSRGDLGVGALLARADLAAQIIFRGGTAQQKQRWLPRIAYGNLLPTVAVTEPDVGSDLAAVATRAVRSGDTYFVHGSKTRVTHAARADLIVLLARTNPREPGPRGLSILVAEKPRGSEAEPFPAKGLTGRDIEVIGYRGLKEYEIAFDGFAVKADNLLGGVEGRGFEQIMQAFGIAAIQTAARAVGVAQAAMEEALGYAISRVQFGQKTVAFPRVADKIAMMAVEIMLARQLAYHAARARDSGDGAEAEAGMAALLATRVAWACADNAVQIHGGSGFAVEEPASRLFCDARILGIVDGSAEIHAQVVARRLLEAAR